MSLQAVAHAKLNMALHITGKRADGYHLLDSLVVFAKAGDVLTVADSDVFSLKVTGLFSHLTGTAEDNLVSTAAHRLAQYLGVSPRGEVTLEKYLPVGAGLGGGSMDAVVACRLLLKLWGHILPDDVLASLLLPLGADMPMCVMGRPLIARGIGEELIPVSIAVRLYAVLCWPNIALPTVEVYRHYTHENRGFSPLMDSYSDDIFTQLAPTRNMLQRAAISCAPTVAETLLMMETHPTRPFVRMSGSGACCVAYYIDESAADAMAAALRNFQPTWWVMKTEILE